jgi:hypothetical protein
MSGSDGGMRAWEESEVVVIMSRVKIVFGEQIIAASGVDGRITGKIYLKGAAINIGTTYYICIKHQIRCFKNTLKEIKYDNQYHR